jgi:hypothetical protein
VAQTGKNFSGFNDVDWNQVGISSAIGGVAGAVGGAAGYYASNASFLVNGISSLVLRSAVVSPLASGAGHVAGGTTANLFAGQNLGDAFSNSFDGIGQSMAIGTAIGVSATIATSYANGVNPWNGEKLTIDLKSIGAKGTSINKISDSYLKQKGFDAHAIKNEYLGKNAQISRYNLYKTPSGQIFISDGKNVQIPTSYFIK